MKSKLALLRVLVFLCLLPVALPAVAEETPPTAEEAVAFLESAEAQLLDAWIARARASWVNANFITHDTNLLAAAAEQGVIDLSLALAQEAARFNGVELGETERRKLDKIKLSIDLPAPPESTEELATIASRLTSIYGSGRYENRTGETFDVVQTGRTFTESRDAEELLDVWKGWRTVSPAMREDFERYVELANKGAQNLGFTDLGALWRSRYDMDPDDFAVELDRLFEQVLPLYEALHCHVRAKLREHYGSDVVPAEGPIPAHLLGNIWAQTWSNVYEMVAPGIKRPRLRPHRPSRGTR